MESNYLLVNKTYPYKPNYLQGMKFILNEPSSNFIVKSYHKVDKNICYETISNRQFPKILNVNVNNLDDHMIDIKPDYYKSFYKGIKENKAKEELDKAIKTFYKETEKSIYNSNVNILNNAPPISNKHTFGNSTLSQFHNFNATFSAMRKRLKNESNLSSNAFFSGKKNKCTEMSKEFIVNSHIKKRQKSKIKIKEINFDYGSLKTLSTFQFNLKR